MHCVFVFEGRSNSLYLKKNKKWVKFTYMGRETTYITKLFKNTSMKVAYATNNSLGKLLETQKCHQQNKFDKNGVYQLT